MPTTSTTEEAAALVRTMVHAQTTLERLIASRDRELNEVNAKHAPLIAEMDSAIASSVELLEAFALSHPELFEEASSLLLDTHRIGWTPGKWKVTLDESTTEEDVIAELKKIVKRGTAEDASNRAAARAEIASFLLRTTTALDKKRCLEESEREEVLKLLGEVGVWLSKTPTFFVRPDRAGQKPARVAKAAA